MSRSQAYLVATAEVDGCSEEEVHRLRSMNSDQLDELSDKEDHIDLEASVQHFRNLNGAHWSRKKQIALHGIESAQNRRDAHAKQAVLREKRRQARKQDPSHADEV